MAAGVLGLVAGVLASLIGSFVVLLWSSVEGRPAVGVALVVMPICLGHLAGAILVLCGRSPALLVITALPLAGLAVVQLVGTDAFSVLARPSLTSALPLVMGLLAGTAAGTALVTCRTGGGSGRRRPGALALPEEPWWP